MSLELYNKTNRTKELPKFNYAGKFRLAPGAVYPIQDYMVSFYRPWNKVGVIVRNSASVEDIIEPEVKKVIEESKATPETVEEVVEVVPVEEPIKEEPVETPTVETPTIEVEEVIEEKKEFVEPEIVEIEEEEIVETTKETTEEAETETYTREFLENLTVNGVREIAEKLGLEVTGGDLRKKTPYIEAILNSQTN